MMKAGLILLGKLRQGRRSYFCRFDRECGANFNAIFVSFGAADALLRIDSPVNIVFLLESRWKHFRPLISQGYKEGVYKKCLVTEKQSDVQRLN
jgi:hypothetical protein